MKAVFQILGLLVLLLLVTLATLKLKHQGGDGPSRLFPGGKLVSGNLYEGPEPDWSFTDDIFTIELETADETSRLIFIMESDGAIYVGSGYMRSFLGKLWKDWAFDVEEGLRNAVIRVNGTRYERQLVRVKPEEASRDLARKFAIKYGGGDNPEVIEGLLTGIAEGDMWMFRLEPRSANEN